VGGFWPRIYVVEKGHARGIYFLLQTRSFWYFSAPSTPFTCCYLLASAFHRMCWLSHIRLQSGRSADLRGVRWCGIERGLVAFAPTPRPAARQDTPRFGHGNTGAACLVPPGAQKSRRGPPPWKLSGIRSPLHRLTESFLEKTSKASLQCQTPCSAPQGQRAEGVTKVLPVHH
jgi:hypothetical protein